MYPDLDTLLKRRQIARTIIRSVAAFLALCTMLSPLLGFDAPRAVVFGCLVIATGFLLAFGDAMARWIVRPQPVVCPDCDYPIVDPRPARCPECGAQLL